MTTVIDFASGPPSAAAIRAAGHTGVVLYISDAREPWMTGKNPSRAYLDDLEAHGIHYAWVYQFRGGGSMASGDAGRGFEGGKADADIALRRLNDLRCSEHPVFFAVDWDVSLAEWNSTVNHYFRGAVSKLGKNRVGIYGHSKVISWAMEDDVVATVAPGRVLGWQTRSWSGGVVAQSYSVLYQKVHNVPGPGGVKIDVNDVFHDAWGWKPLRAETGPVQHTGGYKLTGTQFSCDIVIDTPDSGWRDPFKVQAGVFHTTENGDTATPDNVARWQSNPANGSSYNVLVGTNGRTVRGNPDDRRPWAAGEPGNTNAIHLSNIGFAARGDWFQFLLQLEENARWAADLHLRYGLPLVWLTPADLRAGRRGFTSHGNWFHGRGGPAYRSDPGTNFPHQWVLNRARELITTTPQEEEVTKEQADEIIRLQRLILAQLAGPETNGKQDFNGWPQNGKRTLNDSVAALGAKLGIPGFTDTKEGK